MYYIVSFSGTGNPFYHHPLFYFVGRRDRISILNISLSPNNWYLKRQREHTEAMLPSYFSAAAQSPVTRPSTDTATVDRSINIEMRAPLQPTISSANPPSTPKIRARLLISDVWRYLLTHITIPLQRLHFNLRLQHRKLHSPRQASVYQRRSSAPYDPTSDPLLLPRMVSNGPG